MGVTVSSSPLQKYHLDIYISRGFLRHKKGASVAPYLSWFKLLKKYHRLGGLKKIYISYSLETGKSRVKVLANSLPTEGHLPGGDGLLLVTSYDRERQHLSLSTLWAVISSMRTSTSWLNYLQKSSPANAITLEIRSSTYEWHTHTVPNTHHQLLLELYF